MQQNASEPLCLSARSEVEELRGRLEAPLVQCHAKLIQIFILGASLTAILETGNIWIQKRSANLALGFCLEGSIALGVLPAVLLPG